MSYTPTPAEIAAATAAIRAENLAAKRANPHAPHKDTAPRIYRTEPGLLEPTRDAVHNSPGPDSWL